MCYTRRPLPFSLLHFVFACVSELSFTQILICFAFLCKVWRWFMHPTGVCVCFACDVLCSRSVHSTHTHTLCCQREFMYPRVWEWVTEMCMCVWEREREIDAVIQFECVSHRSQRRPGLSTGSTSSQPDDLPPGGYILCSNDQQSSFIRRLVQRLWCINCQLQFALLGTTLLFHLNGHVAFTLMRIFFFHDRLTKCFRCLVFLTSVLLWLGE